MNKLTLEAIAVVETVERMGSFSAASEVLNRVPSAISYTVSKLEDQLGVLLFERNGPRVSLTPAGKELVNEGRWLLNASSALESRVRRIATGYETELRITHDAIIPAAALIPALIAFQELDCGTRIRLNEEVMTGVWEALRDERADLIIATGQPPMSGFRVYELGQLEFGFYVATKHPLALHPEPLKRDDLLSHVAIAAADSARSLDTRTVGLLAGQSVITVANTAVKLACQIEGLGHGFLPKSWAAVAVAQGKLVEKSVASPKSAEPVYVATRVGQRGEALKWWLKRLDENGMAQVIQSINQCI